MSVLIAEGCMQVETMMGDDKMTVGPGRRRSSGEDSTENRSSTSPAHWQGEPLPRGSEKKTQDIGFDQRGSGRSQQYGRAGDYGDVYEERERRPQRGGRQPDDYLYEHVQDVFNQSGLNVSDVVVHVNNGVVTLEGSIDADDSYVLERLAVNCRGTVRVENKLRKRTAQHR